MMYLCAGADQAYTRELSGRAVLISAAENTQHAFIAERQAGRVPYLMLDNGAFKAWNSRKPAPTVEAYTAFVLANLAGIDKAIALDVIPGAPDRAPGADEAAAALAATLSNLDYMLAAGVPQDKLAPVVHLRMADWRAVMDRYVALGFKFVCLGGTVKAPKAEAKAWLDAVFAEYPTLSFHLLGLSKKWSRNYPAFSCDSTTWVYLAKSQKADQGIEKNAYIARKLPGFYYHQNRLLGDVAGLGAVHPEEEIQRLRFAGASAMAAKQEQPETPDTWMPAPGTSDWDWAVTMLQQELAWSPEDGPFNPYQAAATLLEAVMLEDWRENYGWDIERMGTGTNDWAYVDAFRPADEFEADSLNWAWNHAAGEAYSWAEAQTRHGVEEVAASDRWAVAAAKAAPGAQLSLFAA